MNLPVLHLILLTLICDGPQPTVRCEGPRDGLLVGRWVVDFPADQDSPEGSPRSHGRLAAAPAGDNHIQPAMVEIHTVPALEGIRFALDGRIFESDKEGVASIRSWRDGLHQLEVLPSQPASSKQRIEFSRWGDAVFTAQREIILSGSLTLEAGFQVWYSVQIRFVDRHGAAVDPDRVSSVNLRNSIGDIYTLSGAEREWLQAGQVVGRDTKLEQIPIVYTVQSVTVDGSSVVNRGQQRFTVDSQAQPEVELLLFSAEISSRDALFGFPLGRGIRLEYPDGSASTFLFEDAPPLQLESLARGTYRATVVGAAGFAPSSLFVLSRDQHVDAMVISLLDLLVAFLIGVSVLLGLFLLGRPKFLGRRRRGRAPLGEGLAAPRLNGAGDEADLGE